MNWTGLAWVAGYLIAVAITSRILLAQVYADEHHLDGFDYVLAAVFGLIWPVVAVSVFVYFLIHFAWVPLVTPSALRRDRRAALDQGAADAAAEQARQHGLPYPTRASEPVGPISIDEDDQP